jgi:hypothetical protein
MLKFFHVVVPLHLGGASVVHLDAARVVTVFSRVLLGVLLQFGEVLWHWNRDAVCSMALHFRIFRVGRPTLRLGAIHRSNHRKPFRTVPLA